MEKMVEVESIDEDTVDLASDDTAELVDEDTAELADVLVDTRLSNEETSSIELAEWLKLEDNPFSMDIWLASSDDLNVFTSVEVEGDDNWQETES